MITVEHRLWTPLNSEHPRYNKQFWKAQLSFRSLHYLRNPWMADTPQSVQQSGFAVLIESKQYLTILI